MPKSYDLEKGFKNNRLTFIRDTDPYIDKKGNKYKQVYVVCSCTPKKEFIVRRDMFVNGFVKSCGCWNAEKAKERMTTHGISNTRVYFIYKDMKRRCYSPQRKNYKHYGGRGITICDEWLNSPLEFYNWAMNNGYESHLTIDRIDNDGNYCPENCQWITREDSTKKQVYDRGQLIEGIDPQGKSYIFINKSEFAREHELQSTKISAVINGKRNHHKGWVFKNLDTITKEEI